MKNLNLNESRLENIIISPSGQLYGSENVLFDFLKGSDKKYKVYVPKGSDFYNKLRDNNFLTLGFNNLKLLYLKLFFQLLFQRKNLILNEAGHIKYIKILAKLLPYRKFVLIIRLLEDCNVNLNSLSNNIELIAVSNFIKDKVVSNRSVHVIYDPYSLTRKNPLNKVFKNDRIPVGIIGRLTQSKGLDNFIDLINSLSSDEKNQYKFLFFGTYDLNNEWFQKFKSHLDKNPDLSYQFMGFVSDQTKLFQSCQVILHFNKIEALGRILFEAINYNLPFLCFEQGGTGELAHNLGLDDFTFSEIKEIPSKLEAIKTMNLECYLENARKKIHSDFHPETYSKKIERFL